MQLKQIPEEMFDFRVDRLACITYDYAESRSKMISQLSLFFWLKS